MKTAVCLLALINVAHLLAQTQQHSLSGAVLDAETNFPLANANVFIDKSLMGSATDSSGLFHLHNVQPGTYDLVASMIGYETQKREIIITSDSKTQIVFKLRPILLQGPEVVVTAEHEKQWQRDLEKFTALLLSTTQNVKETKILNPQVLVFSENQEGQFEAAAQAPLLIENQALGYKLDFVLEDFVATAQNLSYSGSTKFEELTPKSDEQNEKWQKNRRKAYLGSLRHFLAIVGSTPPRIDAKLKEEGFEVFSFKHVWERENMRAAEPVNWRTFSRRGKTPDEILLSFPDYLGVKYLNEHEERNFLIQYHIEGDPRPQESWLKLEQGPVKIDRLGRYQSDAALTKFGYWAWERLADMLPFEYKP